MGFFFFFFEDQEPLSEEEQFGQARVFKESL